MTAVEAVEVLADDYYWSYMDAANTNDRLVVKTIENLVCDLIHAIVKDRKITMDMFKKIKEGAP